MRGRTVIPGVKSIEGMQSSGVYRWYGAIQELLDQGENLRSLLRQRYPDAHSNVIRAMAGRIERADLDATLLANGDIHPTRGEAVRDPSFADVGAWAYEVRATMRETIEVLPGQTEDVEKTVLVTVWSDGPLSAAQVRAQAEKAALYSVTHDSPPASGGFTEAAAMTDFELITLRRS